MMTFENIHWCGNEQGYLKIIDQTVLPEKLKYLKLKTASRVYQAIKTLKTRGAPAIGIAAGYGVFLGIRNVRTQRFNKFLLTLKKVCTYLFKARPTAVNLRWALERIKAIAMKNRTKSIRIIKKLILKEAHQILKEDRNMCRQLGQYGARFIKNGYGVLTHCNAGSLATGGSGTALAAIYQAQKDGKKFRVYATETRPLLQGSRLTSWELYQSRINVTLLCDNMVGKLMSEGKVNLVLVGADRIACNGDTANKIGTYQLALLAHYHRIPFYVVAPSSTFDLKIKNGSMIPVEYRHPEEVIYIKNQAISPKRVNVYNPAFDITPAKYITAIVMEKAIIRLPYHKNISKYLTETGKKF